MLPPLRSVLSPLTLGLLLPLGAAAQTDASPPSPPAVTLDGRISSGEWTGADTHGLTGGGSVSLRRDADHLYVAVQDTTFGWSHVYLRRGDTIRVLHASAALGTAVYVRDGESWRLTHPFEWGVRDTTFSEAAEAEREAFFARHGWVANTNMMGSRRVLEFRIHRGLADPSRPGLAVLYAEDPAAPGYWPSELADGTLDPDLVRGTSPDRLAFRPETWDALGPADGRSPAAPRVRLFEPGLISTSDADDLTPTFSPDGRRLVFVRREAGGPFTLHESVLGAEGWTRPRPLPFSGAWNDQAPSFSPSGATLFFQSRRPAPGTTPSAERPRDDDLWRVDLRGGEWGTPRPLSSPVHRTPPDSGGIAFEGREMAPSIALDGSLYYWSAIPDDVRGGSDLYVARASGEGWLAPRGVGPSVNSPHYETHPWVAPDGSFLLFACDGCEDSFGAADVYVTRATEAGWTAPVNLGPGVNSPDFDFGASLSPDGRHLHLSSNRPVDGWEGRPTQNVWRIPVAEVPALSFLAPSVPHGEGDTTVQVEYLANEGVLISGAHGRVLVDALFGDGIPGYAALDGPLRDSVDSGLGRFHVDLLLVTHVHRDHFDASAVARHLRARPRTRLVAPPQVLDSLRTLAGFHPPRGSVVVAPRPGESSGLVAGGVEVRALGIGHPPSRNDPVEHVAYVLGLDGREVLHLGDAAPTAAELRGLFAPATVDLLLAPHWVTSGSEAPDLAKALGRPALASFHVPVGRREPADRSGWTWLVRPRQVVRIGGG